jgi:hypothetical protein
MTTENERSREACPRCGEHRLAVLDVPDVELTGYQPANATMGIATDVRLEGAPGIGCLACGAQWPDLDAFRAEKATGQA